jgi:nucleoside-triphosphatase
MLFTPNKNIFILACEKHSGKTTALLQWIKDKENIAGILSPDINGVRHFYDIEHATYFTMLASANEETLPVGKYIFSKGAFDKANSILLSIKNKFIIIDEIGPLELTGNGFADTLKIILRNKNYSNLLLVVRNELVEDVVNYFSIDKKEVCFITIEDVTNNKIQI